MFRTLRLTAFWTFGIFHYFWAFRNLFFRDGLNVSMYFEGEGLKGLKFSNCLEYLRCLVRYTSTHLKFWAFGVNVLFFSIWTLGNYTIMLNELQSLRSLTINNAVSCWDCCVECSDLFQTFRTFWDVWKAFELLELVQISSIEHFDLFMITFTFQVDTQESLPSAIFWASRGHRYLPFTLPPIALIFMGHRVQNSHCSSIFIECCYLPFSRFPLINSDCKKRSLRISEHVRSVKMELTK